MQFSGDPFSDPFVVSKHYSHRYRHKHRHESPKRAFFHTDARSQHVVACVACPPQRTGADRTRGARGARARASPGGARRPGPTHASGAAPPARPSPPHRANPNGETRRGGSGSAGGAATTSRGPGLQTHATGRSCAVPDNAALLPTAGAATSSAATTRLCFF